MPLLNINTKPRRHKWSSQSWIMTMK
jgi:hypothetical protein